MITLSGPEPDSWRGATLAMRIGLALSLASIVGLLTDQTTMHRLADHVAVQYEPYGAIPDPNVLFAYLYATAGVGVAVWLLAIRAAQRRRWWVPLLATATFIVGAVLAVFNLVVSEHGTQIFPILWSVLGLLPSVAGLAAVTLLWTRVSRARRVG